MSPAGNQPGSGWADVTEALRDRAFFGSCPRSTLSFPQDSVPSNVQGQLTIAHAGDPLIDRKGSRGSPTGQGGQREP